MAASAERMKAMRRRRQAQGLRELRLTVPDARATSVRQRVAGAVARLHPQDEADSLRWIEAVSKFDTDGGDAAR